MWWLVPALITAVTFGLAWRVFSAERSDWGVLLVGILEAVAIVAAAFVSLVAWLVYFILN